MGYTYVEPGKVFGNIYFTGVKEASTHIIDTGDGLILLDAGYPEFLDTVIENMHKIGFSEKDIKIILLSHGHFDHAGGAKKLREITNGKIYLGEGDKNMAEGTEDTSLSPDKDYRLKYSFTPDVLIKDGDEIVLGNTRILCVSTPGHTDGTMSFFFRASDGNKTLLAGMHGGVGTNTLTDDFLRSRNLPFSKRNEFISGLKKVRNKPVKVFLGNHTWNNNTIEKLQAVKDGNPDAFVCPEEWQKFIDGVIEKTGNL